MLRVFGILLPFMVYLSIVQVNTVSWWRV